MGLRVFIELKKYISNFKEYPLCITWKAIDLHYMISNIEQHINNNVQLIAYEETNKDTLDLSEQDNMAAQENAYSTQDIIIQNVTTDEPKEGQLYKEKVLMTVIENYAIRKKFQFKVYKSSASRYLRTKKNLIKS